MSPRTGRPRADNPINKRFSVCFDEKMLKQLELYCQANEITKGEAVRRGIRLLLEQEK
ncbi:CopG family transcriptional regulator [Pseudoflavonifractor sp. 60]|nr:CopG family transcriptional regulator [Pseudoflavonifractor sp. 60]